MKTTRSEKLFKEACELIPGGVNSPVRACLGVGADPLFIASAKGSHVRFVFGQCGGFFLQLFRHPFPFTRQPG